MPLQVQVIPNSVLYCNNSTSTNHRVSALSNGQFLVDGYFVINKYQLETDFAIVPIMIGVLGVSDEEISIHGQEIKAQVENFQQQGMDQCEPYKSFGTELRTHSPEEDKDAEDNKDEQARNIHNVTTEFTTARINSLSIKDKPVHIRVTDTHLIPDGYYATNLIIGDVDQENIYCYYK